MSNGKRGTPDPLPPQPSKMALKWADQVRNMASDEVRKEFLKILPPEDWDAYLAGRHYRDAQERNRLIEKPELVPDKLERVRILNRLGNGTPHYETQAQVEAIIG